MAFFACLACIVYISAPWNSWAPPPISQKKIDAGTATGCKCHLAYDKIAQASAPSHDPSIQSGHATAHA